VALECHNGNPCRLCWGASAQLGHAAAARHDALNDNIVLANIHYTILQDEALQQYRDSAGLQILLRKIQLHCVARAVTAVLCTVDVQPLAAVVPH
jgi:hypothetical protein